MRLKVIACKVLCRELYYLAWNSPHVVDLDLVEQQLHNTPEKLRLRVQEEIDAAEREEPGWDAIALGYGLCSNGIVGLKTQKTPLVIPRGHDCITLLLGSRQRYQELFHSGRKGIYWYSPGWIEFANQPSKERYDETYRRYVERFGEENAEYLMEMEQGWMKEYTHALYVAWPALDRDVYWNYTRECADFLGWKAEKIPGDESLLRAMLDGDWDASRFLVVPPGSTVAPSYDSLVVKASPAHE